MARRFQNGSLELRATAEGPCWYVRFTSSDGERPRFRIGLKSQYPTRAKAERAAQYLRDRFNSVPVELTRTNRTFGDVVARYEQEEMPARFSTRRGYSRMHRLYIVPRWGTVLLSEINPLAVRSWLRSLDCLSTRTRGHIHGQMKNLFKHALLWQWLPPQVNPMSLFQTQGSTRRARKPRVISPAQFRALLEFFKTDLRMQALVTAGFCLGLRSSEIFALRWRDFDHHENIVRIRRAIVQGRVDQVKTERSDAPLPLARFVAELFLRWRQETPCREDEDWVFASPYKGGIKPLDASNLQTRVLRPAGKDIGLDFNLGWHTLRHSYKSLLDRVSADASLKRDLMRHADVHTTLQVYGEVEIDRLRLVNDQAVALAFTE